MSRYALLVGASVGAEASGVLDPTLQRYGYTRITRAERLGEVLEQIDRDEIDLLVIAIDEVSDTELGALERTGLRERGTSIIATGASAEPGLMLKAMRAGIQEYLVRPIQLPELVAAVERLHRRAESGSANGVVFAVFSAKGGVGVTTTAVNLACALTRLHADARVAIADFTLPGGDTSILLNVRPSYDLGDIAGKIDRLDDELLKSVMTPAQDGLWVLAAPERPETAELIDANVISSVVQRFRASFSFTLLDCEHQLNDRTLAALDSADRILLLTELKVPALRSAQRTLGVFRRLGYPAQKFAVIVNRYQSGDVVTAAEAADVLKEEIFAKLPNDYRIVSEAATSGIPVVERQPDSRVALAYLQLAQQIGGGTLPSPGTKETVNGSGSRLRHLFARKRN